MRSNEGELHYQILNRKVGMYRLINPLITHLLKELQELFTKESIIIFIRDIIKWRRCMKKILKFIANFLVIGVISVFMWFLVAGLGLGVRGLANLNEVFIVIFFSLFITAYTKRLGFGWCLLIAVGFVVLLRLFMPEIHV